jgi:rare lipoprotein A
MDPDEKMIFSSTIVLATIILAGLVILATGHWVKRGQASWYSNQGSGPITANGERFRAHDMTAASWDYPLGTCLEVTNTASLAKINVRINDRGPSRSLYLKGRILDLSKGAFAKIADLEQGVITVTIKQVNQEQCHDKKKGQ